MESNEGRPLSCKQQLHFMIKVHIHLHRAEFCTEHFTVLKFGKTSVAVKLQNGVEGKFEEENLSYKYVIK